MFNDKHLSTTWSEYREMVDDAKRLEFPFYAGSSLPVTWRLPSFELPLGTPLKESVCVAYGGVDSYDFHALETAQCMSERRLGGEVGIKSVHAVSHDTLWNKLGQRSDTQRLFLSALSEVTTSGNRLSICKAKHRVGSTDTTNTIGYFIEHLDGFTAIFLTGIQIFYAGMRADNGKIVGCQMMLPMPGQSATTADFFNPLTFHVEQMIVHQKTAYPVERTLLTSGMVIGGVESLHSGQIEIEAPDMRVEYQAAEESMFWQE